MTISPIGFQPGDPEQKNTGVQPAVQAAVLNEQHEIADQYSFDHLSQILDEAIDDRTLWTATAIAGQCEVSSATIRNRWWPWIAKTGPVESLRAGTKYTALAHALFIDFLLRATGGNDRDEWVAEVSHLVVELLHPNGSLDAAIEGEIAPVIPDPDPPADAATGVLAIYDGVAPSLDAAIEVAQTNAIQGALTVTNRLTQAGQASHAQQVRLAQLQAITEWTQETELKAVAAETKAALDAQMAAAVSKAQGQTPAP